MSSLLLVNEWRKEASSLWLMLFFVLKSIPPKSMKVIVYSALISPLAITSYRLSAKLSQQSV
jgi:hypothetical protein